MLLVYTCTCAYRRDCVYWLVEIVCKLLASHEVVLCNGQVSVIVSRFLLKVCCWMLPNLFAVSVNASSGMDGEVTTFH